MRIWLILVLFLASIFFEGIVFPALFGFRESFFTVIFIVAVLLYYEANLRGLVLGMIFSGLAEFYWGLKLGTLILPLLGSAGILFLLGKFFNIKSRILTIILGVTMFVIFWEASFFMEKIL